MSNFIHDRFVWFPEWISDFWLIVYLIHWAIGIIAYETVLRHVRPLTHGNEELHKKYPTFRRNDAKWMTYRIMYYLAIPQFVPRFILVIIALVSLAVGGIVLGIGLPKGKNVPIIGIRYLLMRVWNAIWSRVLVFAINNCWYINYRRPSTCYKKYLGEDWKADYDGPCSTLVANHQAF